jgi:hypothetical protein
MDRNSSAGKLTPVLSVENLIRGILTLGERLTKMILVSLQKGLENLTKANLLSPCVAKEFRQLKAKILESRTEETTMHSENKMITIADIGRMMFENGWEVHLLVNDGCYPNIGSRNKKLAAAGYKQVGKDKFHISIIAGDSWGSPKGPADEYELVEVLISVVGMGNKGNLNSSFDKAKLEELLRDPTTFCQTSIEFYRNRHERKKQRKKIAA